MDEILKDILSIFTLTGIIFVLAVVEVGSRVVKRDEKGKLPRWFIFIPAICGFLYGILSYFSETPDELLATIKVWRRLVDGSMHGIISFAAAIVIFELRKQFWKKLKGRFGFEKGGSDATP